MDAATPAFLLGCGAAALAVRARWLATAAPVAPRKPAVVRSGVAECGGVGSPARGLDASRLQSPAAEREDALSWLRCDARSSPDVLALCRAENAHAAARTAHLERARASLAAELKSRLQETDAGVPAPDGPFVYYTRTVEGLAYPLHCRKLRAAAGAAGAADAEEEVLLDENALAAGNAMCDVVAVSVSPDHSLLAYAVDFSGGEEYTIRFRRLRWRAAAAAGGGAPVAEAVALAPGPAGAVLPDVIPSTAGDLEWDGASAAIFYTTLDKTHRPHRVHRHVLGTPRADDELLLEEADERFWVGMDRSLSGDVLFLEASSKLTSEVTALALTPRAEAALALAPRASTARALDRAADDADDDGAGSGAGSGDDGDGADADAAAADAADAALAAAAAAPGGAPPRPPLPLAVVVAPRADGVLYAAEHMRRAGGGADDALVITTNARGAMNFKIAVAPLARPDAWADVLPHSERLHVTGVAVFADFWALEGREGGYAGVWVARGAALRAAVDAALAGAPAPALRLEPLPPRERVFVLGLGQNDEYDATTLRFTYSSMTTPTLTCEADVGGGADAAWSWAAPRGAPGAIAVLKQKAAPNVDPAHYRCVRSVATAADGARVPISILYRPSAHALKGGAGASTAAGDGGGDDACPFAAPAPLLLYAYGSYGHSIDPYFSSHVFSLADRGVVYAIAHVRGGGEMGRAWYELHGKLLAKKNTFSDYIACAEHLVAQGWTAPGRIGAQGGSAGGLLMGVAANERPDLWAGVLAEVPFVDVLTTMSDPTIPLTVTEWEECVRRRPHVAARRPAFPWRHSLLSLPPSPLSVLPPRQVGQPQRVGLLRVHPLLLPGGQCAAPALRAHAPRGRAARHARGLLGTAQVCAARARGARGLAVGHPVQNRARRRARRRHGPLRVPQAEGVLVGVAAPLPRRRRLSGARRGGCRGKVWRVRGGGSLPSAHAFKRRAPASIAAPTRRPPRPPWPPPSPRAARRPAAAPCRRRRPAGAGNERGAVERAPVSAVRARKRPTRTLTGTDT
jgi:oligopeptidase B